MSVKPKTSQFHPTLGPGHALADQKRTEKGAFDDRIYCDIVEIEEGNASLEYYRANPENYPESVVREA